jgi:C1A family cysteine protease
MNRKYGWRGPGPGDHRDVEYSFRKVLAPQAPADIPPVKYLICGPVVDQADLGSCASFAATSNMVSTAEEVSGRPLNLSQLWLYYRYRELYGHVEYDDGAFLRDIIRTLATEGVCLEDDWPYVLKNWNKKPPPETYEAAKTNRIKSYHALYTREDMIQCIASGYGFFGGISVYESFESLATEKTGIVQIPDIKEKWLGGHAVYFPNYDLHQNMIGFQNSWGREWGDDGFGWIPIEYLTNPRLAGDFWTIRF